MNIEPCNPINKVANSSILNNIFDAMAKIAFHDLRVHTITLEKDRYNELITRKGSLDYLCHNINKPEDFFIDTDRTEEGALIGALFGANLRIGKESKVYSEKGLVPSGLELKDRLDPTISESELADKYDENWQMSFDINFDKSPNSFQRKLAQLKGNLTIFVKSRARPIYAVSNSEQTAIETLREMITEAEFRKYIIRGFILVKGQSGRVYQVFRSRDHTIVWEKGKIIEEVCVRIKDRKIPPTDNLIAFKIMIEADENTFKKLGNVYNMSSRAA